MKTRNLLFISLLTLLSALSVYAQSHAVRAKIPFAFSAAGKRFPAGQYDFFPNEGSPIIKMASEDGKISVLITALTRTAGAIHNTPEDAHVVFDKMGETYVLSELWVPGIDGYVLSTTKEKHEHHVVNVPVK